MGARFVFMANGPLSRPKLPGIPGVETFKGHSFHTSRWDDDYTGGNTTGGLDKLAGKRVAIIGTGATAVQCVPHVGAHAKHLYVFQRTPSSVDARNNRPTERDFVDAHGRGVERITEKGVVVDGQEYEVDCLIFATGFEVGTSYERDTTSWAVMV